MQFLERFESQMHQEKYVIIKRELYDTFLNDDEYVALMKKNYLFKRKSPAGVYLDLHKLLGAEKYRLLISYVMNKFYTSRAYERYPTKTAIFQIVLFMFKNANEFMTEMTLFPI